MKKVKMIGEYRVGELLGRGAFGKVRKATHVKTGLEVAIKSINPPESATEAEKAGIEREITILSTLKHDSIVHLYDTIKDGKTVHLVMEVLGMPLYDYVVRCGFLEEQEARVIFTHILAGVHYCHSKHITHRDLKPENLLFNLAGTSLKITDFGLSNLMGESLLRTFCGSPIYAAPEVYSNVPYEGKAVDIWSMGVILYVMVSGEMPWRMRGNGCSVENVTDYLAGTFGYSPHVNISKECKHFISRMIQASPATRASIAELCVHPWIKGTKLPPGINMGVPLHLFLASTSTTSTISATPPHSKPANEAGTTSTPTTTPKTTTTPSPPEKKEDPKPTPKPQQQPQTTPKPQQQPTTTTTTPTTTTTAPTTTTTTPTTSKSPPKNAESPPVTTTSAIYTPHTTETPAASTTPSPTGTSSSSSSPPDLNVESPKDAEPAPMPGMPRVLPQASLSLNIHDYLTDKEEYELCDEIETVLVKLSTIKKKGPAPSGSGAGSTYSSSGQGRSPMNSGQSWGSTIKVSPSTINVESDNMSVGYPSSGSDKSSGSSGNGDAHTEYSSLSSARSQMSGLSESSSPGSGLISGLTSGLTSGFGGRRGIQWKRIDDFTFRVKDLLSGIKFIIEILQLKDDGEYQDKRVLRFTYRKGNDALRYTALRNAVLKIVGL